MSNEEENTSKALTQIEGNKKAGNSDTNIITIMSYIAMVLWCYYHHTAMVLVSKTFVKFSDEWYEMDIVQWNISKFFYIPLIPCNLNFFMDTELKKGLHSWNDRGHEMRFIIIFYFLLADASSVPSIEKEPENVAFGKSAKPGELRYHVIIIIFIKKCIKDHYFYP